MDYEILSSIDLNYALQKYNIFQFRLSEQFRNRLNSVFSSVLGFQLSFRFRKRAKKSDVNFIQRLSKYSVFQFDSFLFLKYP